MDKLCQHQVKAIEDKLQQNILLLVIICFKFKQVVSALTADSLVISKNIAPLVALVFKKEKTMFMLLQKIENFEQYAYLSIESVNPNCCFHDQQKFPRDSTKRAAPQHVCPTPKFLPDVRHRMEGLNYLAMGSTDTPILVNLIFDIRPWITNWRTGGLCQSCQANEAQWHFEESQVAFDRILNGDYNANENKKHLAIRMALTHFNNKLDAFEVYYDNCE